MPFSGVERIHGFAFGLPFGRARYTTPFTLPLISVPSLVEVMLSGYTPVSSMTISVGDERLAAALAPVDRLVHRMRAMAAAAASAIRRTRHLIRPSCRYVFEGGYRRDSARARARAFAALIAFRWVQRRHRAPGGRIGTTTWRARAGKSYTDVPLL